jgi:dTDP-glucose 4,6-dehydratase
MTKFCVTGASGFLGSHIVDMLVAKGEEVVVVLDKNRYGNIEHLKDKVEFVHGDIRDIYDCREAVQNADVVLHLAALISVDQSIQEPQKFYETNVRGTVNLLEAIRLNSSVKKLVYMSSCECYGHIPKGKANENHLCTPRSPYASSKYAAERFCLAYYLTYKKPEITVVRGFNIYGPRQSYGAKGAVIPTFILNALNKKPYYINGDGTQTRDYVHVSDTAKGVLAAAYQTGIGGEVFNLATGQETSIKDLSNKILDLAGHPFKPIHREARAGELMRSCGDASKARRVLGWKPTVRFDEGLKATFEWYKQNFQQ